MLTINELNVILKRPWRLYGRLIYYLTQHNGSTLTMYSSKAIANYFLDKGDYDRVDITPMQLIKLVYIAHGWYLALKDKPLIEDNVEAWQFGPVIPELYHEFKYYGSEPIDGRAFEEVLASIYNDPTQEPVSDFLDELWSQYKDFTAIELSNMTHLPNTPWDITRKENMFKRNPVIVDDLIKSYYKQMIEKPYDEFCDEWYPF